MRDYDVSTIDSNGIDVIGRALDLVVEMLGIKEQPTPQASINIIKFIHTHYGYMSPMEIVFAFECALVGKIDVDLNHYNQISIMYLSRVLNEYKKFRVKRK